jgi:hypothetical protein
MCLLRTAVTATVFVLGLAFLSPMLFGQVPRKMSYQGMLTTSGGIAVADGSYSFEFTLYDTLNGGIALWTETQAGVSVHQGTFTVILGSVTPISFAFTKTVYLEITTTAGPPGPSYPLTFSPRSELTSAPYALAPWAQTGNDISYTTGNVGIGTTTPTQQLEITGNFQLPQSTGTTGILYSGSNTLMHSYGPNNFFAGENAGNLSMTGNGNVGVGNSALEGNTVGYGNTSVGSATLRFNTTGHYNTASGHRALHSNTTGYSNTASGYYALYSNTTGNFNTAHGHYALYFNTGTDNTAIGAGALYANTGADNTASGSYSLYSNTTGNYNTSNGSFALFLNSSGSYNSAFGYEALFGNSTNHQNTAVGYRALRNTTASDFNTAVGANAGDSYNNGYNNVFVGANVDVNQTGLYNVIAVGQATVVGASSTARFGNTATGSYGGWANWTNLSDGRYKKNVRENVPGIEFIKRLRPITYTLDATGLDAFYHKDDEESPLTPAAKAVHERALQEKERVVYTGFVAQEVEAAARDLGYDFSGVDAPKNDNDTYGLRYAEFVVPLVKAVQDLDDRNRELDNQNKKLAVRVEQLESLLKSPTKEK